MTSATNPALLQLRIVRQLPPSLAKSVNPATLTVIVQTAFDNGWRDADWLAAAALLGTSHPNIHNPAALFASQLRAAADTPCPIDATPQPPSIDDLRRRGVIRERGTGRVPDRLRAALGFGRATA